MKKFCMEFGITLAVCLIIISLFNWYVDPFYHYHKPLGSLKTYLYNQVYQTPGVAEHFTYDSAIVGSSMTENFRASWYEDMGYHTVKMSYSGAHTSDLNIILNKVYASHNDVKFIIMDLNDFQLTTDADLQFAEQPQYLYEDNWWDDTLYLWNNDVFWSSMGNVLACMTDHCTDIDDFYTWEDPSLFSKGKVMETCREYMDSIKLQIQNKTLEKYDGLQEYEYCADNMENLTSVIESHPETQFYFFYPPYSILYWEEQVLTGRLDTILSVYQLSMETLLKYDNVRVFYFQDETQIIENLDGYRDTCHFTPAVNKYIFECMRDGEKEINVSNLRQHLESMRKIAADYSYDDIWRE